MIKKILTFTIAAAVSLLLLAGCAQKAAAQSYHCPMHPDYVSDRPGDCPICGMRLVPMTSSSPPRAPAVEKAGGRREAAPHKDIYTCPMHPEVQSNKPGTCLKCGMDLVKKEAPTPEKGIGQPDARGVPGLTPVETDAARADLAGVRTVAAVG
jgi:hypothetical protein